MNKNLKTEAFQICRTCMKKIISTSFFHMNFMQANTELTIRQKLSDCIPELNLSIVPNAVICSDCADIVNSIYKFKSECLRLEMQIQEYINIKQEQCGGDVNLVEVAQFYQPDDNLSMELKTEVLEIEDVKTEIFYDDPLNEANKSIEIKNASLERIDMQHAHFHMDEKSATEKNLDHNSLRSNTEISTIQKPFKCSDCEYRCNAKSKLKIHMRIHTGEMFICSLCEYKTNEKYRLGQHMLTHTHTELKRFTCSLCNYRSNVKCNLQKHMSIHTQEKPYKCTLCEYRFGWKNHLKNHMRIHTGEKPFSCSVCDYCCNRKEYLKIHMQVHTLEKPLKCSACNYQTNRRSYLNKHMLIHAENK